MLWACFPQLLTEREEKETALQELSVIRTVEHEKFLFQAAELGRELVGEEIPTEEIAEMHELAIKELGKSSSETKLLDAATRISQPLMEVLMSYGLAFRERLEIQNQAKKKLQKSEEKFRVLYNHSPDMYVSVSPGTETILECNETLIKKTGYSREEIIGSPIFKMYHDDCMDEVKKTFQEFVETGVVQDKELILKRKDGGKIDVSINVDAVRDDSGKILHFTSSWRDITSRKQAEEELYLLNTAIEQSVEVVLITDTLGEIQYVNPAFERITGYTLAEAKGQNASIVKSGEHDPAFYKDLWDTISAGKVWHGKMNNRRKDGSLYREETTISPVIDSAGNISNYVAVKRDVTKEEKLKQQFLQAQKMESVGRLAGGVAHDFNNMLVVIMGYSEMALAEMDPTDKLYKDIQEINKAGQRSVDLIKQLLAFSRKQTIAPRVMNLNDTVSTMLEMLRRLIGEDINLAWMPGANLGTINIDPAQIDQILANLCVNTRDAIDGPGKLIIGTENVTFDEAYCQTHTDAQPGAYIMLTVSDDGCGMDEETKMQIFEPFFTTKASGEGTGLGLATVFGIVKQNDGLIDVYSEPGQGTSFKIYFPQYKGVDIAEKAVKEKKLPAGHGELILLVEDEETIVEMVQSMLENMGYSVIAANTPQEALRLAREQSDKIELLLTDVVMPGMNGKELANQLHVSYPEIKILFMSGYTSNIIAQHGVLDEGVNFITKPFSFPDLGVKLQEVLKQK